MWAPENADPYLVAKGGGKGEEESMDKKTGEAIRKGHEKEGTTKKDEVQRNCAQNTTSRGWKASFGNHRSTPYGTQGKGEGVGLGKDGLKRSYKSFGGCNKKKKGKGPQTLTAGGLQRRGAKRGNKGGFSVLGSKTSSRYRWSGK